MDKQFDASSVEVRWSRRWEELAISHADPASPRPPFTIALPPPNITAPLHMGHAMGGSVQDSLIRHRRMRGYEVEWCPGTDHAAIATNAVIERQLLAEGTSKEAVGREAFQARVDAWYEECGGRIYEQMRRLGFSCDWARSRFTLDAGYVRAIRTVFKALFDQGLIYRGPRIVNWCPHDRSAISDEEVEHIEHQDLLTHLRYPLEGGGDVVVATVRPETMLGDTAVAVNPEDPRHRHLIGRWATLPLTGRRVPVIGDSAVLLDFGTGALKVTPGHDPTDYEIGTRHGLPIISVIAPDGTMDVPELPRFHGLTVERARREVTQALDELGAVVAEEPYVHEVGHCERCHHVVEPLVSEQWWVRMADLAAPAIGAVESGAIRFHPQRYTDFYLGWMRGIRDWCISRQIWLGHAIPVSTCANGHRFAWVEPPSACPSCGSTELRHDPDVLDTWFSSALWPFAIFGWPDETPELSRFYPTEVLTTAREIIFLWVARMIMVGLRFTGSKPFSDVLITSTILARDGSRMSKSRGNVVDPLEIIGRYGADAIRAWAAAVGTSGQDQRFDEERVASFQKFANKIWNVTRLLVSRLGDGESIPSAPSGLPPRALLPEDRWILGRLADTLQAVDQAISQYRFHDAVERLYSAIWQDFCSDYMEIVKVRLEDGVSPPSRAAAAATAVGTLDAMLRLLHPFMPFVTEECAQRLPDAAPSLQLRDWPQLDSGWSDPAHAGEQAAIDELMELVRALRARRQEAGISASDPTRHPVVVRGGGHELSADDRRRVLEALVRVRVVPSADGPAQVIVSGGLEAELHLPSGAGEERLRRQLADLESQAARLHARLSDPGFRDHAPAGVVAGTQQRLDEAARQAEALRRRLGPGV
ncbi:MAG TPA: valine--tRNA ligase [Candidatus Binatia bacterium]|nr:valine--tRNA ligase [Candidatus Binatia bacterium]